MTLLQMVFVLLSLTGQDSPAVTGKPVVTHVAMAAPDVIAVSIRAQSVERGKQVPYERQPGDEIITWRQHRYVLRGDTRIGALVGSEGRIIQMPDRLCGEPLDTLHVNQVGFRPDDPVKLAFLSCWMGSGGNLGYPACLSFGIVDDETGDVVFSGKTTLAKAAAAEGNRTKAEVHEMDFSEFTASGVYRASVEGVGCSFPFEIGDDVWQKAFIKSMRGLYCQRSGVALGPPHTDFVRPRGFHPEDGVKVYVSEPHTPGEDETLRELPRELWALIDSFEPGQGRFRQWMDDLTSQTLPNAWGGYMDAGDWDGAAALRGSNRRRPH